MWMDWPGLRCGWIGQDFEGRIDRQRRELQKIQEEKAQLLGLEHRTVPSLPVAYPLRLRQGWNTSWAVISPVQSKLHRPTRCCAVPIMDPPIWCIERLRRAVAD